MTRAAILGGGAVGQALARALPRAGVEVALRWNRSRMRRPWTTRLPPLPPFDLVFLAVTDAAVEPLCAALEVGKGQLVVHLAGALPLSALAAARVRGAAVGSLHPLRAIVHGDRAPFAGAAAGVAASSRAARRTLEDLARALGMEPLAVPDRGRALYHAAAVLAAGAQVALFSEAVRTFRAATGASEREAREALLPLSLGALGKLRTSTAAKALSGPVVRGDAATIDAHRRALPADLRTLYEALTRVALRLAREGRRIGPGEARAIAGALGKRPPAHR